MASLFFYHFKNIVHSSVVNISDCVFHSVCLNTTSTIEQNPELVEKWKAGTGLDIYEGYGQTETVCIYINHLILSSINSVYTLSRFEKKCSRMFL